MSNFNDELVWSVQNGDLDKINTLFESSPSDAKTAVKEGIGGRPLLHVAADYGQAEMIDFLIKHGADVNVTDKHGITALLAAVYENHVECVRLLLEKGADKTLKTPSGETYAEAAESEEIKALLLA